MTGKSTRRALLTSALAILACVAMLVGTTFAWFTDTASTAVNTIQAGNLHVKVMYSTDMKEWKDVEANTELLDGDALWEPGHTQIVYLKVVNAGNLALKYEIRTNSYARGDRGKNADGKFFYVDTYLRIGLAETQAAFATRDAALAAIADNEHAMAKRLQLTNGWTTLDAEEESGAYAMVIYMPTTVGNEANNVDPKKKPSFKDLKLLVNAVQAPVEYDSIDNTYDAKAPTSLDGVEYNSGDHVVEGESFLATGGYGVIQVGGGTTTINNTNVTAKETNMGQGYRALAVYAQNDATVIINSGNFEQIITGTSDMYELIYAVDNAQVIINGGTFKCATPKWTLNCLDGNNAKFTVNGGRFYKFNPATDNPGEVVLGEGCQVTQDGDWFVVSR